MLTKRKYSLHCIVHRQTDMLDLWNLGRSRRSCRKWQAIWLNWLLLLGVRATYYNGSGNDLSFVLVSLSHFPLETAEHWICGRGQLACLTSEISLLAPTTIPMLKYFLRNSMCHVQESVYASVYADAVCNQKRYQLSIEPSMQSSHGMFAAKPPWHLWYYILPIYDL